MTVTTMPSTTIPNYQEIARRYANAWNTHDVGAIMAMHSDDTLYHLHGEARSIGAARRSPANLPNSSNKSPISISI